MGEGEADVRRSPTRPLALFSVTLLTATAAVDGGAPWEIVATLSAAAVWFAILTLQALRDEEDE